MSVREWFEKEVERLTKEVGTKTYSDLVVIEVGVDKEYTWKSIKDGKRIPAIALYAVVENVKTDRKHVVALAKSPEDGKLYIWCNDTELHQKLSIRRHPCNFWRRRTCKHTRYVMYFLKEKSSGPLNDAVEEFLDSLRTTIRKTKNSDRQVEVETILRLWEPTLIVGPTGSGKSHTILSTLQQKKEAGELEYSVINFTSGVEDTDLLAKFIPTPDGKWTVVDGELWKAFKQASTLPEGKKYVVVLEELSRATPKALNVLVKAMDGVASEYVLQNFVTGESISVPKQKFQFIALANLGTSYSGTEELDPALMRRFLLVRFWDYDTDKERELLDKLVSDSGLVERVMKFVQSQRDSYKRGEYPYPLDTGTLLNWVKFKKQAGVSFWEAFEFTCLYRLVDRDEHGFPDEVQVESLKSLMQDLGL